MIPYAEMACESEAHLQYHWGALASGTRLPMNDGRTVIVESPGTLNTEAGPDFRNARLVIDGIVCIGDVEVHRRAAEWYQHGHDNDGRYANVILHVVQMPSNAKAPSLPTLLLDPDDTDDLFPEIPVGECASIIAELPDDTVLDILSTAGLERFMLKTEAVCRTIIRDGAENAALRMMFDAAGYKNNRAAFAGLFNRWQRYDFSDRIEHVEAILWGESGLLPDPSCSDACHPELRDFVRGLWETFWRLRKEASAPLPWTRAGTRPFNHPERRLAALINLIRKTSGNPCARWELIVSQHLSEEELAKTLADDLVSSGTAFDAFWNFTAKAAKPAVLQGKDRAREWAVNVVAPVLAARAWLRQDSASRERFGGLWRHLPAAPENHIVSTAVSRCFGANQKHRASRLMKTAAAQQGLLHLHLNFCEQNQSVCRTCKLIH